MKRLAVGLAIATLACPWPGRAQQRHQLTFEAWPNRGAVGYARAVAPRLHVGGEFGVGLGTDTRVLVPRGEESRGELVSVAAFARFSQPLSTRWTTAWLVSDVGARAAIADLEPLLPTLLGAYVQPMVGSRHVSVGPRLVAGWVQPGDGDGYFALLFVPLSLRLTLDW